MPSNSYVILNFLCACLLCVQQLLTSENCNAERRKQPLRVLWPQAFKADCCLFKLVSGDKAYGSPQVLDLGRAQVCCCWGISQRMNSGGNWVACIFNLKTIQGIAAFNFLLLENEILKILISQLLKTCKQVLGLYCSLIFFHFSRASFNVCWCLEDQIGRTTTESFISQHN